MTTILTKLRGMDRQRFESLFTSSAFLLTSGLLFINLFILTRGLGTSGRGMVAAAYGNTIVLGWAFQIGVPTAAGYFAKDLDNRRIAMSAWAMTVVGAVPIAILLIPFFRWQLRGEVFTEGGETLRNFYLVFILLQLFNGVFLSAVFWLRGVGSLVKYNLLLALPQVLITLGYLVLWILGRLTVNSALTSTFVMLALGWIVGITATDSWPGRGFSREIFGQVRHYSLRAWAGNLSFFVSLRIDQLLLVSFVDSEQLGVYAIAAAISTLSGPIARGFAQGLLPFIRKAQSDDERLGRITTTLRQVGVLSFAILGLMGATAWFIIPFVLGDDAQGAVLPLMILLPGAWATDVTQVYTTALTSFNRPGDASKAQIAAAIVTAIGLATLLSPFGIVGAAVTTTVSYVVGLLVSIFYWRRLRGRVVRGEATGHSEPIEATEPIDDSEEQRPFAGQVAHFDGAVLVDPLQPEANPTELRAPQRQPLFRFDAAVFRTALQPAWIALALGASLLAGFGALWVGLQQDAGETSTTFVYARRVGFLDRTLPELDDHVNEIINALEFEEVFFPIEDRLLLTPGEDFDLEIGVVEDTQSLVEITITTDRSGEADRIARIVAEEMVSFVLVGQEISIATEITDLEREIDRLQGEQIRLTAVAGGVTPSALERRIETELAGFASGALNAPVSGFEGELRQQLTAVAPLATEFSQNARTIGALEAQRGNSVAERLDIVSGLESINAEWYRSITPPETTSNVPVAIALAFAAAVPALVVATGLVVLNVARRVSREDSIHREPIANEKRAPATVVHA